MEKLRNPIIFVWLALLTGLLIYFVGILCNPKKENGWMQSVFSLYNDDPHKNIGIGVNHPEAKLDVNGTFLNETTYKDGTKSSLSNGHDLTGLGITGGQFIKTFGKGDFGGLVFGSNKPGEINTRILGCFLADFNQHCAGMECTYTPESNNFITQLTASNGGDTATEIFLTDYTGVRFKMGFRSRQNNIYIQSPSQGGPAMIIYPDSGHAGIKIHDGSQGPGYVMTCDSGGTGSWQMHDMSGSSIFSGTGSIKSFTVKHNLGHVPSKILVTPSSQDGADRFYVSAKTATEFTIAYLNAPASGRGNISFDWLLKP